MQPSRTLYARLRAAAVKNWPIKVTALVLSAVLWAAVAAEEPTTRLVPVDLSIDAPPGRTITGPLPAVQAIYSGAARELIKLVNSPPVIRKAVPDTLSGNEYRVELSVEDLLIGGDVDAHPQAVQPRILVISLNDVTRKSVRVAPRVRIVPDAGYALVGGIAVVPSRVTVLGPESAVQSISSVPTVWLELRRVTSPVRRMVRLDTTVLGGTRVIPREVEISAEVAFIAERVLVGVPIAIQPDDAEWLADPPAVIVTVRGPSTRLVHLTRDSVSVIASLQSGTGPDTVALEVVPPPGITAVATPDSTVLTRLVRG